MLTLRHVDVHYGERPVLQHMTFCIQPGNVLLVEGRHGSGRSTLLKAIAGQVGIHAGQILLEQQEITHQSAYLRARAGISWLPENRQLFAGLSVRDNLWLGCGPRWDKNEKKQALYKAYEQYRLLAQRSKVAAGTLSGGEQQLLAFVRSAISRPRLLLLDEPAEGLAAQIVSQVALHLLELKAQGVAIILVEQNRRLALMHGLATHQLILGNDHAVLEAVS